MKSDTRGRPSPVLALLAAVWLPGCGGGSQHAPLPTGLAALTSWSEGETRLYALMSTPCAPWPPLSQDLARYTTDPPLAVLGVRLFSDGRTVALTTAVQTPGVRYRVIDRWASARPSDFVHADILVTSLATSAATDATHIVVVAVEGTGEPVGGYAWAIDPPLAIRAVEDLPRPPVPVSDEGWPLWDDWYRAVRLTTAEQDPSTAYTVVGSMTSPYRDGEEPDRVAVAR